MIKRQWFPYFLIFLIGFLLYFKTLFFNFTYLDDNVLIIDNFFFLKNLKNIFQAFRSDVFQILHSQDAYYRPILTISLILDAQLGGASPFFYHLTNIIIHLLVSSLVFFFLKRIGYQRDLAFFFAFIFTIHPVLAQAVAWIPGRNDSLLTFFILISFIYFLNFFKTKKILDFLSHLLFLILALFTKETAFVLVLIIFLYLRLIAKEKVFSSFEKLLMLGWFVILLLWFPLRQAALVNPLKLSIFEIGKSLFLNLPAIIFYLGKIITPFNLSVYPILKDSSFIYGSISFLLLIFRLFFSQRKRLNFVFFGALWFILFLLPSLIRPNPKITADFLDHRIYLPIVGFFITIAEFDFFKNFNFQNKSYLILSFFLSVFFSLITFFHSDNFSNRLKFWSNAVKNSPNSPLAHRNLGAMLYFEGNLDQAEKEYQKALELNPFEEMVHNNLGVIYMDKGLFDKAEEEYKKELEINPFYDKTYFNLGLLYFKRGKFKEAEEFWKKTIKINPEYFSAYQNLATLYYQQNKTQEALFYLRQLQKQKMGGQPTQEF